MGGQLRQRAGVVRPAELAVVFGFLGCFGSIPGSPRLGREMADFGGAFAAEIEGWAAEERVYGELRGAAQSVGTSGRGAARWLGGRRP